MKIIVLVLLVVFFTACKNTSTGIVDVNVDLKNVPAQTIYLKLNDGKNKALTVDSARYNGKGSFSLHTKVIEPSLLELVFGNNISIPLVSAGEKINLKGSYDSLQNMTVSGSSDTESLLSFLKNNNKDRLAIQVSYEKINALTAQKKADSSLPALQLEVKQKIENNLQQKIAYARNAKNPILAFVALRTLNFQEEETRVKPLLDSLAIKYKSNSFFSNAYATLTNPPPAPKANIEKPSTVSTVAKEISLPDVNGKTVTLSSFKGKYVLVDFWASWCGPCRGENPNVVAAFNKFKNKNFTILGVSLDKSKDAWVNAIAEDGLAWTQVSDLKFWQSQAAQDYGVQSIPFNILVDPQGNIVATDLRGADLHTKLGEVLR